MIYRGILLDKLLITTCRQAHYAPFIDTCTSYDEKGNQYNGYAMFIDLFKRYALVIAWKK